MTNKVKVIINKDKTFNGYLINCEGCGINHIIDERWTFNGDPKNPTFKPSLLVRYPWGEEQKEVVCHSFITNGKIKYLNDCTHHLSGQEIELPEAKWMDKD